MFWTRMACGLVAMALLAVACGGSDPTPVTVEPQAVEASATGGASSDDPGASGETGSGETGSGADESGTVASGSDSSAGADSGGADLGAVDADVPASTPVEDGSDSSGSEASVDAEPALDVEALVAVALAQLDKLSVRTEMTMEFLPGFGLRATVESDADGDVATQLSIPPGLDPVLVDGAQIDVRTVSGVDYVRLPASEALLEELGVAEAWYVVEPDAPLVGPFADTLSMADGLLCTGNAEADDCDPRAGAGDLLRVAQDLQLVGREEVRGVGTTRVRFSVSLADLYGEAFGGLGGLDDVEESEGAFFDDGSSELFDEGLGDLFGFLDAPFEVEVWIDDDSLARRLSYDVSALFGGLAEGDDMVPALLIVLEFYDYDADISVEAPPPEMIIEDLSPFMRPDETAIAGGT